MIHPLVLSLPSPAIISRPRRHRHHTTTPSLPSHSRSLHHYRLLRVTPLVASCGDRRRIVRGASATMGLFTVTKKATTPFEGQKPGTSGLRKKVPFPPLPYLVPGLRLSSYGPIPDLSVSVTRRVRARFWCLGSAARQPSLPATSRISPGFRAGSRGSVLSVLLLGSAGKRLSDECCSEHDC